MRYDKALAIIAAAGICSYLLYLTNGKSGIGWFVLLTLIICDES